jgi:hypothetical protein
MKSMKRWLMMAGMAGAMCLGSNPAFAQQDNQAPGQGRPPRGNFDPAQFRERMMERVKEQLEVTDEAEWKVIQPLVEKVMDARMSGMGGMGRGMFGGPRGGGNNNDPAARRGPPGQTPSPESETLQKAVDGKASNAELKTAMAKVVEARKVKQAELEKSQADLRKVLSVRQEAIATLNGWL